VAVGLRLRSTAARLLPSWVRIPQGAWTFVCCVCCVLSGRGLCDELITRSEESYRLWSVDVCDRERRCVLSGASMCVITKPRERGGHSPRWAAVPEKIIIIIIIIKFYWKLNVVLWHNENKKKIVQLYYSFCFIEDDKNFCLALYPKLNPDCLISYFVSEGWRHKITYVATLRKST
jgi:hypothetical protein